MISLKKGQKKSAIWKRNLKSEKKGNAIGRQNLISGVEFLQSRRRNWYQKRKYGEFKGVRGTPRQDIAFRAHEMRILRRSVERPLPKKKGEAHGKTKR